MTTPASGGEDRRALVHIGWPKTATTSMQHQLRNWPNLAGRPWTRSGGDRSRSVLRYLVMGLPVDPAEIDGLLESSWIDRTQPVVLSDEAIVALPRWQHQPGRPDPAEVAALLTACSWPVTAIATLREPAPLLRSSYRYAVKAGYDRGYRQYLADITANLDRQRGPMAIRHLLTAWEEAVGEGNVVITWMEDYVADPQAFWGHLAEVLDTPELAAVGDQPPVHLNQVRLNPVWIEMAVNRLFAAHRGKRRSRWGRRFRRVYNRHVGRRLPEARRPIQTGCEDLEREVVTRLERDLDWVCEHFGTRRPYERGA